MADRDLCCSIAPYFEVKDENLAAFKALCNQCVEQSEKEPGCLYYGFSFSDGAVHCREGYQDANALLTHVGNIDPLLQQMLQISTVTRLEVHGPESELAKLREPLKDTHAKFFVLETGFRR